MRSRASPLLHQFAIQAIAWGSAELVIVWIAKSSLAVRDLGGARQLERFLWLACGLEGGVVAVGATLAITCLLVGRRLGGIGSGISIATQGAGLLVLDLSFANALVRLV